ncbi:hypothetical protein AMTRI_Chr01g131370 [Amborella trichopoda]
MIANEGWAFLYSSHIVRIRCDLPTEKLKRASLCLILHYIKSYVPKSLCLHPLSLSRPSLFSSLSRISSSISFWVFLGPCALSF